MPHAVMFQRPVSMLFDRPVLDHDRRGRRDGADVPEHRLRIQQRRAQQVLGNRIDIGLGGDLRVLQ